MLSAKQGSIQLHFLSLWYHLTWDCTRVSRTIGEHSTRLANEVIKKINKTWTLPESQKNVEHKDVGNTNSMKRLEEV